MYVWRRLLTVMLASKFKPALQPLNDISAIELRVWPQDLDFNRHVNNGRYLCLMDLGRIDLLLRSGLGPRMKRNKWQPVLTGSNTRYRRPLGLFHRFRLETKLSGWTEKSVFMEHSIIALSGPYKGEIAASAVVRAVMLKPGAMAEKVHTAELLASLHFLPESPPLPDACLTLLSPQEREALCDQTHGNVTRAASAGNP